MQRAWVVVGALFVGCHDGGDDAPTVDAPPPAFTELDLSLRDQVAAMEAMTLTSAHLTAGYLDRIHVYDVPDAGTKAFLALNLAAGDTATTLDALRGSGAKLQGAVFGVKDNFDTTDFPTTAGSLALELNRPTADATVVAKLRAANAVIVGKTNLSEWANFRSTASTSGWSSLGGQTKNGKVPAYNPCGSSAGSAAAVAAGTVSAAIGTETAGSIVCPSSINGVVGFKPTVGLVSRAGIIPVSSTQDTAGPIAKTVGDAARILGVIAGVDVADPATAAIPANFDFDFETPLASATLAGKRLGVVRSFVFQDGTNAVFEAELAKLQAAGAILVDVTLAADSTFAADDYTVETYEFKDGINTYLASHARANQPATLADLIAYDSANAATVMPFFGQETFIAAEMTTGLQTQAYLDAKGRVHAAALDNGIAAALAAQSLDALISPTADPAWLTHYPGDQSGYIDALYAAAAGCPHLTVPMGAVGPLPVGMSFFGGPFDDAKVLQLGYAYEQIRGATGTSVRYVEPTPRLVPEPAYAHAGR